MHRNEESVAVVTTMKDQSTNKEKRRPRLYTFYPVDDPETAVVCFPDEEEEEEEHDRTFSSTTANGHHRGSFLNDATASFANNAFSSSGADRPQRRKRARVCFHVNEAESENEEAAAAPKTTPSTTKDRRDDSATAPNVA